MIAVITAALGGSVLGTLIFAGQKARQPTLADRLRQAEPFPAGREPPKATRMPALPTPVRRYWVRLDERYQAWVQTHLLAEQPSRAWMVLDGVEVEIPFEQLRRGDILVLTAGQMVPVDGVVVQGAATVDQHRLTGESQPAEKAAGDPVLAATLVLGGRMQVRVEKTGAETAAARIGEVLERAVEG